MAEFHPLRSLDKRKGDEHWDALDKQAIDLAKGEPTAPLPCLDHLTYEDFEQVYEPAEDTYLLLDALQYELQQMKRNQQHPQSLLCRDDRVDPVICLEIGCGSGVASAFFRTQWLKCSTENSSTTIGTKTPLLSFVTDVNPRALQVTRQTFQQAAKSVENPEIASKIAAIEAIRCDLASALLPRLEHKVSVLIFNPPYVPTPDEEVGSDDIAAAWAGGVDGRRVIDRAVPQFASLLERPAGVGYLVTVDDNRPAELAERFQSFGLRMRPLFRRRAKNEFLTIQKITWMDSQNDQVEITDNN